MRRLGLCLFVLLVGGCHAARPRQLLRPAYPRMLQAARVEGRVVARVSVARDGRPERIVIDSAEGPRGLFAWAVRAAIGKSAFAPARRFGVPVRGAVAFPVRFVLLRPASPPEAGGRESGLESLPATCPAPSEPDEVVVCAHTERPHRQVVY